jgi:hypothetical protein
MTTKKNLQIEFANFVFHMGERNMLDCFVDFIYPALFNKKLRKYGESTYFFHNMRILDIEISGEIQYFVYGRLVKNGLLHQEQIIENDNLVPVDNVYPNAPSSIFILSLTNHRLFLIQEHRDAPTFDTLKSTILHFVKDIRNQHINDVYTERNIQREERGGNGRKLTKKSLKEQHPEPELELIPLSSDADLSEFINSMVLIDSLTLEIVKPNNEGDLTPIFGNMRDIKSEVGSDKCAMTFKKGDKKSLKHEKVAKYAAAASKDSNVHYIFSGKDSNNSKYTGTNDQFKLRVPIKEELDTPKSTTMIIYYKFLDLVKDGFLRQPDTGDSKSLSDKISNIINLLKGFGNG